MRTRNKIFLVATLCLLLWNQNRAFSQIYMPLQNSLPCAVVLSYEMWDSNCKAYGGTVTLQANSASPILLINNLTDMCITIVSIGGTPVPLNHESYQVCHNVTPVGTSGTTCGGWSSGFVGPPGTLWQIQ